MEGTMTMRKKVPATTPWGRSDNSQTLCRGVVRHSTPGHGGLGVAPVWAVKNLSPQALALATRQYGKFWFEEDCQCALVFYEHPELLRVASPTYCAGKADSELRAYVEPALRTYYAQYFEPEFIELCKAAAPLPPTITKGCVVKLSGNAALFTVLDTQTRNGYTLEWQGQQFYAPKGRVFDDCVKVLRPLANGTTKVWRDPNVEWNERKR